MRRLFLIHPLLFFLSSISAIRFSIYSAGYRGPATPLPNIPDNIRIPDSVKNIPGCDAEKCHLFVAKLLKTHEKDLHQAQKDFKNKTEINTKKIEKFMMKRIDKCNSQIDDLDQKCNEKLDTCNNNLVFRLNRCTEQGNKKYLELNQEFDECKMNYDVLMHQCNEQYD